MTSPNSSVGRDSVRDDHETHSTFGTITTATAIAPFTRTGQPGTHSIRSHQ